MSPADVVAFAKASQRAAAHWPALPLAAPPARVQIRSAAAGDSAPHRIALLLSGPLFGDEPDAPAAAARLSGALRDSGLFAEARLSQALASAPGNTAARTAALGELVRMPTDLALGERAAAQLEVLRRDVLAFTLTAWSGQEASLDIGRERITADGGPLGADAAAPVYFATLNLDLPKLGAVTVRLRLVNSTVAASVEAADPEPWRTALPELAAQLGARGLQTAALMAMPTQRDDDNGGA